MSDSEKVTLRLPDEVHAYLLKIAAVAGVTIDQVVSVLLAVQLERNKHDNT